MMDLVGLLVGGAGGGVLGGVFGLARHFMDSRKSVSMENIKLDRDKLDAEESKKEREHALLLIEKQSDVRLAETEARIEGEISIEHSKALREGQKVFHGLKTTSKMDNYRASVRPTLAYWFSVIFSGFLFWSFYNFSDTLIQSAPQMMIGLVSTLTFIVTSIITFFYVSRPNARV
tara:strand:+ start:1642 stop:2166 length:525 start_codon:yes stop_codon:yes gene_type:complete